MLDTVRPVLQIDIHVDLPFRRFQYDRTNIVNVLLGSFSKLFGDMLIRALAKQVHDTATCGFNPVERDRTIHETQDLQFV